MASWEIVLGGAIALAGGAIEQERRIVRDVRGAAAAIYTELYEQDLTFGLWYSVAHEELRTQPGVSLSDNDLQGMLAGDLVTMFAEHSLSIHSIPVLPRSAWEAHRATFAIGASREQVDVVAGWYVWANDLSILSLDDVEEFHIVAFDACKQVMDLTLRRRAWRSIRNSYAWRLGERDASGKAAK